MTDVTLQVFTLLNKASLEITDFEIQVRPPNGSLRRSAVDLIRRHTGLTSHDAAIQLDLWRMIIKV